VAVKGKGEMDTWYLVAARQLHERAKVG